MSNYKNYLRRTLAGMDLDADRILSIGAQEDDRKYFRHVRCEEWKTMDIDEQFNPSIVFNMNREILSEDDGDLALDSDYIEHFDKVLALNLWEYIYDPVTAHKNIYRLLRTDGTYMGSYVFVYGKHPPNGTDYLRYTDDGIRKLLTAALFRDINIIPIPCSDVLRQFYANEGMRVRKDIDHNIVGYIATARK